MMVLVTGSRGWQDAGSVRARLAQLPAGSLVIHGGARGVDRMATEACNDLGIECRVFSADWGREGRRAGIQRNLRMLDQEPDLVLAWWDGQSRGTLHTITEAARRGIPVEVA